MAYAPTARSGASHDLAVRWQRFVRWWLSGLAEVVPAAWLHWAEQEAAPKLTVWREQQMVVCRLTSASGVVDARFPAADFAAATLETWLAEKGLGRDEVTLGPVIPQGLFFRRELRVPKAALDALPRILDQEVLRRTPFQLSEIWHAATDAAGGTNDIASMYHWIIRRDRAEAALAEFGLKISDVDFLATGEAGAQTFPVIDFRTAGDEDPAWAPRAVRLLAVVALVAVVCGLAAFEWRQASVAATIETALAEARQGVQSGRDGIDPAGRLLAMKSDVGVLEVWDELSRILPDHTFLTESRMADGKLTLSGFSADAAKLVRIIDQSPLFSGAALTAAITPDANEHKERFSISFKVRATRLVRSPGTGGSVTR
jgi:general secretion pathway protein L